MNAFYKKTGQRCLFTMFSVSVLAPVCARAVDFGIYEARGLAMGGAAVALGRGQQAQYVNPALLAQYEGQEEDTRNGRVYLPTLVAQLSDSVESTIEVIDDELDVSVSDAVAIYNANPNSTTAAGVADAVRDLQDGLDKVGDRRINGDAYAGFSVSEPSDHAGGAFYFGVRVVAGGNSRITQSDRELLSDYVEAIDFIVSGGSEGELHPELRDTNGDLISPTEEIDSSATIAALAFAEWGVAFAREFQILGQSIALGATPKLLRVDVYRDVFTYGDSDINYRDDKKTHLAFNTDLGLVWRFADVYRVGLTVKELMPYRYNTGNNLSIETKPRTRLGAAYVTDTLSVGFDYDLSSNDLLGITESSRQLALGLEYLPWKWLALRGGYLQETEASSGDIISGGFGFKFGRFVSDLAYSSSDEGEGAALQLGWSF